MATQRTSSARTSSGTGTKKTATKKATKKAGGQQAGAGKRGSQSPATSSDDPAHDGQHHDGAQDHDGAQRGRTGAPRAAAQRRSKAAQVAQGVGQQLADLIGKEPEAVTGLERTEDGWRVQVEVVEVRRIPDTTDVLALYEVDVDEDGDLESYHRTRRYTRGAAGEG